MHSKMRQEIDALLKQIKVFGDKRRQKIKKFESVMLRHVEDEIIQLLNNHGFAIIEHQLGDWILAVRKYDQLRIWFPKKMKDSDLGAYTINFALNGVQSGVAVLIKHRYANLDYNYLTVDYTKELQNKIAELNVQLEELHAIDGSDIDGSYFAIRRSDQETNNVEFQSLSNCFSSLVQQSEAK